MQVLRLVRVLSLEELRGIDRKVAPGLEVILIPSKKRYIFNPGSTAADDGDSIVAPTEDLADCCRKGSGRWELESASAAADDDSGLVGSTPTALVLLEASETSGASGAGGGSFIDIGTAVINFILAQTSDVDILGSATAAIDFAHRTNAVLAVNVDGIDYPGSVVSSNTLGQFINAPAIVQKMVTLGPGAHTITLRGAGTVGFLSSVSEPSRIRILYVDGATAGGAIAGGDLFSAENKDVVTIKKGQVVAIHSSGVGIVLADGTAAGKEAIGLATEDIAVGFSGLVQFDGVLDIPDWTDATGAATLPARSLWYLDTTAGKLTSTPPGTPGNISQVCGSAFSTTKLKIEIDDEAYLL